MNGYSLTDKMIKTRKEFKLNAVDQALFYELVTVCNEKSWQEVFRCSNARLRNALNITEPTLIKAREALIKSGLIYFQSGRNKHITSSYSFTVAFKEESTTKNTLVADTKNTLGVTTKNILDYNKHNNKTPSIPQGIERVSIVRNISFDEVKPQLLADDAWKELIAIKSGISREFLNILPVQVDAFLQHIVLIGEEHTIKNLSDAKRRFFWWWTNHGKKTYEKESNNYDTEIW